MCIRDRISTAANIIRFITIFFAALNFLIWIGSIYVLRVKLFTHFIREIVFWVYGCAILCTFVYLIPFQGLNSIIHEAGAIAVFAAWCSALLQLEPFGNLGIYVSMLVSTIKNVLKVLVIGFFLFCAFGFSLHILVGSLSELQFTKVGTSLVSSFSAAVAIIDLESFVAFEFIGLLRFPILTFIFYILMLIILPIALINLLIGLAVGDIAQIQEKAEISRRILKVTNLAKVDERLVTTNMLIKFARKTYTFYPNATGRSLTERICRRFMRLVNGYSSPAVIIKASEEGQQITDEDDQTLTIQELQHQVDELVKTQAKHTEALTRMETMLQKLMEHQGL